MAVTAVSTAVPLLSSTFTAISEHTVSVTSLATAATRMDDNAHAKSLFSRNQASTATYRYKTVTEDPSVSVQQLERQANSGQVR